MSGSRNDTVIVWSLREKKPIRTMKGHTNTVWGVSWSADGRFIASASFDHSVRIWSASTGEQLQQLDGHAASVSSCCFAPNGAFLVSGSRDATVRVYFNMVRLHALLQLALFSPLSTAICATSVNC